MYGKNPLYVSPREMQDDTYDRDLATLARVDPRVDDPHIRWGLWDGLVPEPTDTKS
jgi:hypothetical protein